MYRMIVKANGGVFPEEFTFELTEREDAWYGLDGREAQSCGAVLRINADREVYAVYAAADGTERFGTLGDGENEVLADNFPVCDGEVYLFYENPETKDYYV